MKADKIFDGIYRIGANIENADLFEGIWPIPNGVSINSYVVQGEKTAMIDLVKDWDGAPIKFREELESLDLKFEDIDYLILNHMEPDHTGWLGEFRKQNPTAEILTTKKAVPLIKAFYSIEEGVRAVSDGETLDLGAGKELVFFETPNIHWPETMMTYEKESETLFCCDAFGSFGSLGENKVFDDELTSEEHAFFEEESLRYYANIVSTFSMFVEKGIAKLADLPLKVIAPSHGIIWRENPGAIVERYKEYASYMKGPAKDEVAIIWSSMYGNTESFLKPVIQALDDQKMSYTIHRIPEEHGSFVLASAWQAAGLIIGMPTYEYKMFPPMAHIIDLFDRSHVWNKKVFRFGAYGWSGGAQKQFDEMTAKMKWHYLDPVEWQGAPSEEDKQKGYDQTVALVKEIRGE